MSSHGCASFSEVSTKQRPFAASSQAHGLSSVTLWNHMCCVAHPFEIYESRWRNHGVSRGWSLGATYEVSSRRPTDKTIARDALRESGNGTWPCEML